MNRSGNGKHVYSLNPISERLLESAGPNSGIDKNVILYEEMHDTINPEYERYVHPRETRYPILDRLAEEHF